MRLLLIEDEVELCDALAHILKKNHFGVDKVYDGISGLDLARSAIYDVVILDRMLPGKDGLQVLKELRLENIATPVLFLTAKDTVSDRVEGLDAGADDYLVKPFSTEELLARIRALGRRHHEIVRTRSMMAGNLEFSPSDSTVTCAGKTVKLTQKENLLLELLALNKGKTIPRETILDRVWGIESEVDMNNIEIYIYYLRKKLSSIGANVNIETMRGLGYCLKEV